MDGGRAFSPDARRAGHDTDGDVPAARKARGGGGQEVSRAHAALECYGTRIVLRDLGSRNGTSVDEEAVQERALADGGEFRLGRTRLLLMITDEG